MSETLTEQAKIQKKIKESLSRYPNGAPVHYLAISTGFDKDLLMKYLPLVAEANGLYWKLKPEDKKPAIEIEIAIEADRKPTKKSKEPNMVQANAQGNAPIEKSILQNVCEMLEKQIEVLSDRSLTREQIAIEAERARPMGELTARVVAAHTVALEATKLNLDFGGDKVPRQLRDIGPRSIGVKNG